MTEGPDQVRTNTQVVSCPVTLTCRLSHARCLDATVETSAFNARMYDKTGSHGAARPLKDGAETNLVLPLSPAGQEAPPASMCSHTLIDVTLYSSGAPSRFYLVVAKCSKCFYITDSNSVETGLRALFLLDWKLGIVRIYLNV